MNIIFLFNFVLLAHINFFFFDSLFLLFIFFQLFFIYFFFDSEIIHCYYDSEFNNYNFIFKKIFIIIMKENYSPIVYLVLYVLILFKFMFKYNQNFFFFIKNNDLVLFLILNICFVLKPLFYLDYITQNITFFPLYTNFLNFIHPPLLIFNVVVSTFYFSSSHLLSWFSFFSILLGGI